jgi:hypothetical protein
MKEIDKEQYVLAGRIKGEAGEGRCHTESDCRVVGLGAKTCGRYRNFLFYSMLDAQVSELEANVAAFNRNQNKLVDMSFVVESCGIAMPSVGCIQGKCLDPAKIVEAEPEAPGLVRPKSR